MRPNVWVAILAGSVLAGCEPPQLVQLNPPGIETPEKFPAGSKDAEAAGEQANEIKVEPSTAPDTVSSPDNQGEKVQKLGKNGPIDFITTKLGSGDPCKEGQTVVVHYTGTFVSGKKFQSSKDSDQPLTFKIGSNQVIKGWNYLLPGMKVGEVRKATIQPDLAYGENGKPPVIPPNSSLNFEIELLEIK